MEIKDIVRTPAQQRTFLDLQCDSDELNYVAVRIAEGESILNLIDERMKNGRITPSKKTSLNGGQGDQKLLVRGIYYKSLTDLANEYGLKANTVQKRAGRGKTGNELIRIEDTPCGILCRLEYACSEDDIEHVYTEIKSGLPIWMIKQQLYPGLAEAKSLSKANNSGIYCPDYFEKNPDTKNKEASLYIARIDHHTSDVDYYKVGISTDIARRLRCLGRQFAISLLRDMPTSLFKAYKVEQAILKYYHGKRVDPKEHRQSFDGKTEVLQLDSLELEALFKFIDREIASLDY